MSYKLLKELEDKFEMQHPSGEGFVIAKKGLNKKVVEHIKSLGKGYADGGVVVEPEANPYDETQNIAQAEQQVYQPPNVIQQPVPTPMAGPAQLSQQPMQQDIADAPPSTPQPQAQEVSPQQPMQQDATMGAGYNEAMSGISGTAKVQEDLYKQQADIMKQHEADQVKVDEIHNKNLSNLLQDAEKFGDAANQDVNPNRYWGSLSTGNKISASIGLILGGIGAGMLKGENQALKVIDSAINNDIESQKVNASKNMNMYRQAMDKYKDERVAHNEVKLAQLAIVDSKLKQAELNAKSLEAKQAAKIARGELQMKYAPLIDEQAKKKTQLEIIRMANSNPEAVTPAMVQYLPKEQQERYIPGAGFSAIVPTDKDREAISSAKSVQADLKELIDMSKKGTTVPGSQQDLVNKNKMANVQLKMKSAFQLGVLSQTDYDMLNKLVADPGAIMTGRAVAQLQSTLKSITNTERGIYDKLGIPKQQAQALTQEIKTMNGIPYQKVEGGWRPIKTGK